MIRNTFRFTMIICICHQVSDRDIQRQVDVGCDSFSSLQYELGVSTGCGICRDCAEATFQRCVARSVARSVVSAGAGVALSQVVHLVPASARASA